MATANVRPEAMDFTELVRRHQSMVFSIAYHFLHDRGAAEEVAQDVFLQLHRDLPSLHSDAHATFWLRKTTTHRCIDYARRRQAHPEVELENVPEPVAFAPERDPLLARRLQALVRSLPETPRIIVVLRYQEDLDPAEIARVLEMPVNTVKSHLQRALATLRDKAREIGVRSDEQPR